MRPGHFSSARWRLDWNSREPYEPGMDVSLRIEEGRMRVFSRLRWVFSAVAVYGIGGGIVYTAVRAG